MQKIKFSAIGIMLVLMVALLIDRSSSFASNSAGMADVDWQYTPQGGSTDPLLSSNYTKSPVPSNCTGNQALCGIKAPEDANGEPILSPAIQTDIQNHTQTTGKVFYRR